jgi:hypothetical protein
VFPPYGALAGELILGNEGGKECGGLAQGVSIRIPEEREPLGVRRGRPELNWLVVRAKRSETNPKLERESSSYCQIEENNTVRPLYFFPVRVAYLFRLQRLGRSDDKYRFGH